MHAPTIIILSCNLYIKIYESFSKQKILFHLSLQQFNIIAKHLQTQFYHLHSNYFLLLSIAKV